MMRYFIVLLALIWITGCADSGESSSEKPVQKTNSVADGKDKSKETPPASDKSKQAESNRQTDPGLQSDAQTKADATPQPPGEEKRPQMIPGTRVVPTRTPHFFVALCEANNLTSGTKVVVEALKEISRSGKDCSAIAKALAKLTDFNFTGKLSNLTAGETPDLRPLSFFPDLENLNLSENELRNPGALQPLSALPKLKRLNLRSNYLTTLSELAKWVPKLVDLDVSKNELTGGDAVTLDGLTELEELDLSNNRMSQLPHLSSQPLNRLKKLDLQYNPIETIAPISQFAPNLETLNLYGVPASENGSFLKSLNQLSYLMVAHGPQINRTTFPELPNLRTLSLYGDILARTSDFWILFPKLENLDFYNHDVGEVSNLDRMENLKKLSISNCRLIEVPALPKSLRSLSIAYNFLVTLNDYANLLQNPLPNLKTLQIPVGTLPSGEVTSLREIQAAIRQAYPQIELDSIPFSSLSSTFVRRSKMAKTRFIEAWCSGKPISAEATRVLDILFAAVGENTCLKAAELLVRQQTLMLNKVFAEAAPDTLLLSPLADLLNLERIELENNGFTHIEILKPLAQLPALERLSLSGNHFTSLQGWSGSWGALKDLSFNHNDLLSLEGLSATSAPVLEELRLSQNKIKQAKLADNAAAMTSLKRLDISHNSTENIEGLPKFFPNLENLELAESELSNQSVLPIAGLSKLKSLDLNSSKIDELDGLPAPLSSLEELKVSHEFRDVYGFEVLFPNLKTLQILFLKKFSGDFEKLIHLTELDLSYHELAELPPLPLKLKTLRILQNTLPIAEIRKKYPQLKIVTQY